MSEALTRSETEHLLTTQAIREKASAVFERTVQGAGEFTYDADRLQPTVEFVLKVIQEKYPAGDIPFHSRWGHFRAGQVDRSAWLEAKLAGVDRLERARVKLDLVITSVLLDAGAGALWSYSERETGKSFNRSEGLGVASYHMFMAGAMSGDGEPMRADVDGLKRVTGHELERHFQVSDKNPLLGVSGRLSLLNGLSAAVSDRTRFKDGRPGNILDYLMEKHGEEIPATGILSAVLGGFGSIWPGRLSANGINLGDVWRHSTLGLIPLHKLSQWMTYSLIEPILGAGCNVTGVENLTGLAEYRNGGLMVDMELIEPKDDSVFIVKQKPGSDVIIEWRALTVHLLDLIGVEVQKALGKTPEQFPLAKVLEGGTWWAGRKIANSIRANGEPPLAIESDGTVF